MLSSRVVTSWGGSDYNNSGDRHRVLSRSIHGAKLVLLWKWKTGGYDCAAATFVVLDYFEAFTTIGAWTVGFSKPYMFFGRFVLVMDTSVGFFGKKTKRLLFLMFGDGAGGYRMLHESERFCKIDKWQWRIQGPWLCYTLLVSVAAEQRILRCEPNRMGNLLRYLHPSTLTAELICSPPGYQ